MCLFKSCAINIFGWLRLPRTQLIQAQRRLALSHWQAHWQLHAPRCCMHAYGICSEPCCPSLPMYGVCVRACLCVCVYIHIYIYIYIYITVAADHDVIAVLILNRKAHTRECVPRYYVHVRTFVWSCLPCLSWHTSWMWCTYMHRWYCHGNTTKCVTRIPFLDFCLCMYIHTRRHTVHAYIRAYIHTTL